jgi:hypothetical protein
MKLTHTALAAGILFGASAGAFAQSFGQIIQSGSNDQAMIEQNASAPGSSAIARISQSGGSDNFASVQQGPDGSNAAIRAEANVTQRISSSNFAEVKQIGTTGATSAQLTQENNNDSFARILQSTVNAGQIVAVQSATNSGLDIRQTSGSSSAYAAAEQAGDASLLTISQGQAGAGVTSTQARVYQNGQGAMASSSQYGVSGSSSYISQGSARMPGYYHSGTGWVEVDATVVGEAAPASTANVNQVSGSGLTAYILQYGAEHSGTVGQSGTGHLGGILQTGYFNTASMSQSGTGHVGTIVQSGSGNTADMTQMGSFNTGTIAQSGVGATAWMFQNGSGNTGSITQR